MYMNMYIYMYIYIYIYVYIYMYIYMYIYICIYIHTHIYIRTHIWLFDLIFPGHGWPAVHHGRRDDLGQPANHIYIYICIYVCIFCIVSMFIHKYIYIYIFLFINICIYIYIHKHTHTHTHITFTHLSPRQQFHFRLSRSEIGTHDFPGVCESTGQFQDTAERLDSDGQWRSTLASEGYGDTRNGGTHLNPVVE